MPEPIQPINFKLQDTTKQETAYLSQEDQERANFEEVLKRKLKNLFNFSICQVLALGPLIVHVLKLMNPKYNVKMSNSQI